METASFFARKHGLERYLDDPVGLNETILRLLYLQETMQGESARRNRSCGSQIAVRRTAAGKFTVSCSGDALYGYAVETALKAATAAVPLFQRGRFIRMLRNMGVPEERIAEYCATVTVSDDTLCIDQE